MGWDTPFVRTLAAGASALLLLLGVIGAAVVSPSHKTATNNVAVAAKPGSSTAVEAQGAGAGGGGAATAAPAPAPAAATPAPAAAAAAPAPAAAAPAAQPTPIKPSTSPAQKQPGPMTPPKAGNYTYKTNSGDTSTAKVENDGGANGVTRQAVTLSSAQGSLRTEVAWGPSDVTWESTALTGAQGSGSCDWKPAVKQYAVPLATGTSWTYDSTCSGTSNGVTFSVHRVGTAKVTGVSMFNVGGTDVATWVIERSETTDFAVGLNSNHAQSTSTEQFSPDYGLIVHQITNVSGSDQAAETTLTSLNPS